MFALGLVLVVVAMLLVLVEAHLATGGLVAGGALVALICGVTLLLIGTGAALPAVLTVVAGVCAGSVAVLVLAVRCLGSVRRLRPRSGVDAMVGHIGVLRKRDSAAGVFVDGGLWRAQPSPLEEAGALHDGDPVVVERVNGLTLGVRKAEEWELSPWS